MIKFTKIMIFAALFTAAGYVHADYKLYQCKSWNVEHDSFMDFNINRDNNTGVLTGFLGSAQEGRVLAPVNFPAGTITKKALSVSDLARLGVNLPDASAAYSYSVSSPPFIWIQAFSLGSEFKAVNASGTLLPCE
jgi:hypothetical protein